jgi:hypothetical protein
VAVRDLVAAPGSRAAATFDVTSLGTNLVDLEVPGTPVNPGPRAALPRRAAAVIRRIRLRGELGALITPPGPLLTQLARRIQPSNAARIAWCRLRCLERAARSSSFQRLGQANRPDHGRPSLPLAGVAAPQQHGVGGELRHLPERQEGGSTRLARAGEGVAPHRSEPGEIDRAVERINRSRNALSHAWSPFVR